MKIIGKTFNSLLCGIYSYKHTVELCFQNFSVSVRVLIATETQIYVQICPPLPTKNSSLYAEQRAARKLRTKVFLSFSPPFHSTCATRHMVIPLPPSVRGGRCKFHYRRIKTPLPPSSVPAALPPPHKYHNTPLSTQQAVNNAEDKA